MIWYQEIADSDIDWIIEEICSNLTKGQYIEKCIRSSLAKGNYYGIKALDGDERVGFLTFKRGIEFTYPHPDLEEKIAAMVPAEKVFNGDGIYVKPGIRKDGIGTEMTRRARDMMLRLGGEYYLGELWVYPDGKRLSVTPTDNYGETIYEEYVPHFYKDNDKYGLECAVCGKHCRCGAVVRLVRLG